MRRGDVSVGFLLGILALPAQAAPDPWLEGTFEVAVDLDEDLVRGEGRLRVLNRGPGALVELPLVLYGARFREQDALITDQNFDRFYVRWFDPGDMRLTRVLTAGGQALARRPEASLPPGVCEWVTLPGPLAPGEAVVLHVGFELDVPDRLGGFGVRRGRMILEGGGLPYVPERRADGTFDLSGPPSRTRWDLSVDVEEGAGLLVGGRRVGGTERVRLDGSPPFLAAGDDLVLLLEQAGTGGAPSVSVYGQDGDEEQARALARLAEDAGAYFMERFPGVKTAGSVVFVEAPLRDRFVALAGDDVVLASDRLFEVFIALQGFHEAEVARGVILALVRQALVDVPLGVDRDWACEALAWLVAQEWLASRETLLRGHHIRKGLTWLSFIPAFDRLVKAPRFPGSDLFYGRYHESAEAVPDGFARALSRRARGRVVAEKLRERLGEEGVGALLAGLLGEDPGEEGVRDRAQALAGGDLGPFFDMWLGAPPPQNLLFDEVETIREHEDGSVDVRVRIRREGAPQVGEVGEPVVVEGTGPDGEPTRAVWDGKGETGEVVLRLEGGLWHDLEIDPDHRIFQIDRADDVRPRFPVKVLVNRFRVRVDLNRGNRNEAAVGLTLHPNHDYAHAVTMDGFYEQDERGISLRYAYRFGRVIDERSYGTSVGFGFVAEDLARGVLDGPESTGSLFSVGAGIGFDTRISDANPTWGLGFDFGVEVADGWLGSEFRFRLYRGSLTFLWSVVRGSQVGVDIKLAQADGDDLPTQRLLDAGGYGSIRGVRPSKFVDRALVAIRGEVRQMVVEDLHVPILWLMWLRKVQVVAFLDAGDVGETIEEIVRPGPIWKWGAGGGIRLHTDALGVTNMTIRFDVGIRIDDKAEDPEPQYYVGLNHSF